MKFKVGDRVKVVDSSNWFPNGIDREWWEHLIKLFKSTDEMLSDWNDGFQW